MDNELHTVTYRDGKYTQYNSILKIISVMFQDNFEQIERYLLSLF